MTLNERDQKHLWHPLTQHKLHPNHIAITKAKGAILYDDKGNEYIDGIASWYTCMYGHCNSYIINKVDKQFKNLDHVVFAGFTHEPAIKLSEELIKILPKGQEKIFFSDNGSTAVDVAIKIALQYHFNKGTKRPKIIALENAFHGDTFGAMSASGLSVYNGAFKDFFLEIDRIPVPNETNFEQVKQQFTDLVSSEKVACFLYEPLVQGANCMQIFNEKLLNELIEIAQKHDTLCIADEVMTGFGKTGKNFASEFMEHQPDMVCMSKSLTGGLVPLALTSVSKKVYDAFLSDENTKAFFHGHTYSANPTACTAALASIELLQSDEMQQNIKRIIKKHEEFNDRIKNHPKVKTTRQKGVIFALDLNVNMERYGDLRYQLFDFYMKNGVCLRPLGNTVYLLPPYITSDAQLDKMYKVIEESFRLV